MRYAIFGDIHGNLEAYQAVLDIINKQKVDKCFCVGDIVGYGANPVGCIEITKKLGCVSVCGNHDWAAVGLADIAYFNPQARDAVLWTKEALSPEDCEYLSKLKLVYKNKEFTLVHGSLYRPKEFNYILDTYSARKMLEMMKVNLAFIGHSHKAGVFSFENGEPKYLVKSRVKLEPNKKYLINVGSVGQPRDLNWRAAFCIYDTDKNTIEIKRVEYDVKKARDKILKAGLPENLAYRLEEGR